MENVFKIAKNSIVLMISEIISKAIALCLVIVLARYLGQTQFGRYSFVITLMVLFQVLAEFGLDGLTVREIAKKKSRTSHYLSNVLLLKIVLAILTFFLLGFTAFFLNKPVEVSLSILIIGGAIMFSSLSNTFFSVFNAYERLEYKALIVVFSRLITLILSLAMVIIKATLVPFIAVILAGEIFKSIWCVHFFRRDFEKFDFDYSLSTCMQFLKMGLPFALIGIISLVYFKIDVVMLSVMASDEKVGFYSAAYGLLAAFLFITEAYMLSVFPALSRSAENARNMLFFIWERSVKYLLILSLFITVFVFGLAKNIIEIIFSSSYMPSVPALQVLIWTLPWIFVNAINMRVLYAADKQKQATVVAFFSMVLNISLNFIFIPRFGLLGAAFATVIAEAVNVTIYFYLIRTLLEMRLPLKNLFKPTLGFGAGMVVFLILKQSGYPVAFLASLLVYTGSLFVLKLFDAEDKRILKKIIPILQEK